MHESRLARLARSRRRLVLTGVDAAVWLVAVPVSTYARVDFIFRADLMVLAGLAALGVVAIFVLLGMLIDLHGGRWAVASTEELLSLTAVTLATGGVFLVGNLLVEPNLPRSVPLSACVLAFGAMVWVRALWRWTMDLRRPSARIGRRVDGGRRVLVVGAGDAGTQLVRSMLQDPQATWLPLGLVDDDPWRQRRRFMGLSVLGTIDDLPRILGSVGADAVVVAIPSLGSERMREISALVGDRGVDVKVLPPVRDLMSDGVSPADLRDLDVADLLGRHQVDTDVDTVAGCVRGKRVLVTGAGGSIGSELCRQLSRWDPAALYMLDRDESALHAVKLSIAGRALLDTPDVILADIRDADAIRELFDGVRPDVVFHAAALKHLPMLQRFPTEGFKTNVLGTLNVLRASAAVGVERFVNVSTDKAADPTSVLGRTKRQAEELSAGISKKASGAYLSVRFGNVLGSRGSVLTSFKQQIADGGPVTVTHPDVTRYFMTVQEAVQLTIQAAAIGENGETLVLDMGEPVRIDEVARQLIRISGQHVPVEYTGLREGEKMHEVLLAEGEQDVRRRHPLISHLRVTPADMTRVASGAWQREHRAELAAAAPASLMEGAELVRN